MKRYENAGIQRPTGPGEYGFNKNFQNVNGSYTAVPNATSNGTPVTGLMAQAKAGQTQEYDFAPNKAFPSSNSTQSGLPASQPVGTPPVAPSGPQTGLPVSQPTGTTSAGSNTFNWANTAPTSSPTGKNPMVEQVPGTTGAVSQQRTDDLFNWTLGALNNRNTIELGGQNVGGNNLNADGSWNMPSFLQNGGLMAQFNSGANTDAMTRQVGEDETVAGQLGKLSLRNSDLNRYAMQDAREGAAASGFLGGSSAAEGAALRASRQTMLPVAQQDAAWYGQTAQSNMDAVNRDRLSDQDLRSGLIGQETQIAAQMLENASDRRWKSKEANHERIWNSMENQLSWLRSGVDREDQQNFANADREDTQDFGAWQSGLQRTHDATEAALQRRFQGDENALNRAHERQGQYFQQLFGREGAMASILASIYGNPELTPEQQNAAATNARNVMSQLWSSFNATLALGIPDIFTNPYSQQPGAQPQPSTPTPGQNTPPGTRPPGGYQQLPNGTWPSPVIGTNPDGTPRYATQVGTGNDGIPIFEDENGNLIPYP